MVVGSYELNEDRIKLEDFLSRLEKVSKEDLSTIKLFCDRFSDHYIYNHNREYFLENTQDQINVYNDDLSLKFEEIGNKLFKEGRIEDAKHFYQLAIEVNEFFPDLVRVLFGIYNKFYIIEPEFVLEILKLESWQPEDQDTTSEEWEEFDSIKQTFPGIFDGVETEADYYKYFVNNLKEILSNEEKRKSIPHIEAEEKSVKKCANIIEAVENGDKDSLKNFIDSGVDINEIDEDGLTPIIAATLGGYSDIVQLLIDAKADVDIKNEDGATALFLACEQGHTDIAKMLIASGADINAKCSWDMTPLIRAADFDHPEIVEHLLHNGADVTLKDEDGNTALMKAKEVGSQRIIEMLS